MRLFSKARVQIVMSGVGGGGDTGWQGARRGRLADPWLCFPWAKVMEQRDAHEIKKMSRRAHEELKQAKPKTSHRLLLCFIHSPGKPSIKVIVHCACFLKQAAPHQSRRGRYLLHRPRYARNRQTCRPTQPYACGPKLHEQERSKKGVFTTTYWRCTAVAPHTHAPPIPPPRQYSLH